VSAGEGAFLVAEQLTLEQGLGDGRAVDGDEGARAARAQVVDGAGSQLLAGPALAGEEHGSVHGRDLAQGGENLLHGRARPDHALEAASARVLSQLAVLGLQHVRSGLAGRPQLSRRWA
jgi:hypothetical protein